MLELSERVMLFLWRREREREREREQRGGEGEESVKLFDRVVLGLL